MKNKITLKTKTSLTAHIFISPFYIGFIFFFLRPLLQSLKFVFNSVKVDIGGYVLDYVGFKNIDYVLNVDSTFKEQLLASVGELCWKAPVILIASLFLAIMIKPQFFGRSFVRAVFFLPVIIASGVIIQTMQNDVAASNMLSGSVVSSGSVMQNNALENMMLATGFNEKIVSFFTLLSSNIFSVLWNTGIQMIIFLAGLQSIPTSLYEASAVEGSTAWEDFWKITLPMLTPIILVNTIYTVVDCFTDSGNLVMKKVVSNIDQMHLEWSAAMSWIYFLLIAVVLLIIFGAFSLISNSDRRRKRNDWD